MMNVFDYKKVKRLSTMGPRATYGLTMLDVIEDFQDVYLLSGDLARSSGLSRMIDSHPDRVLNVGIAEQNLVGVSSGLAKAGLIPFASSFAPFITHRCADQIRMNLGYMHQNVKLVGLGSGISMANLGNSHYGNDDLSFLRTIPQLVILSPCDCFEIQKCIYAAIEHEGPVYIRLTGEPNMPMVFEQDFDFSIGKIYPLKEGDDVAIFATGSMVRYSLDAAEMLSTDKINAAVYDVHTIKPFDTSFLDSLSENCKLIVTVEEHGIIGGLGSTVAEYVSARPNLPRLKRIGLPGEYLKSGSYDFMLEKYGLNSEGIYKSISEALND